MASRVAGFLDRQSMGDGKDGPANDGNVNGHIPMANSPDSSLTRHEDEREGKRPRVSATLDSLKAQFQSLCEAIPPLDEHTKCNALHLFHEFAPLLVSSIGSLGSGNENQAAGVWSACTLYCVPKLSTDLCQGSSLKLSQLLSITNVGIWDFFRELQVFLQKVKGALEAGYGHAYDRISQQAKDSQTSFGHLAALFKSYKRNYGRYFVNTTSGSASADMAMRRDKRFQFGWLLFLVLRVHLLKQLDLVTCINGLITVMVILVMHMPGEFRRFSSFKSEVFAVRSIAGANIIASLCHSFEASEEDVQQVVVKASDMMQKILGISFTSMESDIIKEIPEVQTEKLMFFKGLLEESSLDAYLEILNKDYEEAFKQRGELDERMFLERDEVLVGIPPEFSLAVPEGLQDTGYKRKCDSMMSPLKSSFKGGSMTSPSCSPRPSPMKMGCNKMLPPTPITSTMTSAKWLRTVIAPLLAEPSLELLGYFKLCDSDITNEVKNRAQVILEAIFSSERSSNWGILGGVNDIASLDSIWAKERCSEALRLYYRVLGFMCRAESERLHCNNLSALLMNERFHRCMLACSAELVLATYKTVSLSFPAVLEPTGITAFDVWKVVESFVRHEETLPRELKRHLNSIEEKILEKLAWEKGSSMYNSLIVAKAQLQAEIYELGLLAEPITSLEVLQARYQPCDGNFSDKRAPFFSPKKITAVTPCASLKSNCEIHSPVKEQQSILYTFSMTKSRVQPPLQSAFASPQKPSPAGGGETCAETVISIFFQKVLKLAAIRIKILCESLKQPSYVMEDVFHTFQHVLHNETRLFFKRHIDQIILCSMYGVCKVKQLNVTFKQIIQRYKQNPHDSYIYRTVFFDIPSARPLAKGEQGTGDIIGFYNAIFVPVTKVFLMQLTIGTSGAHIADEHGVKSDASPKPSIFSSLPDLSPKKLFANHNVYVSPLRSSKIDSMRPPRSFYACVGESIHAYQSPSKDLAEINSRVNSNRHVGRLDFGEAGLISDSLVKGCLYPNLTNYQTPDSPLNQSESKRPCTDK